MEDIKYEYEEQAKFISQKIAEILRKELEWAAEEGRLNMIPKDSFEDVIKVVENYYSEYNKAYGGINSRGNVNNILKEALAIYASYKEESPKEFVEAPALAGMPDKKRKVENARIEYVRKIKDIKLDFLDNVSSGDVFFLRNFIDKPRYEMGYIGNVGPFTVGIEDENNVPVRTQYMDKKGHILENPIVTYYIDGAWVDTYPIEKTKITPANIESATYKSVTLSDMSDITAEFEQKIKGTEEVKKERDTK